MDKKEMASEFRLTLVRHLRELRKNRESHVTTGNTKSIKRYDRMIKNALKNINKMDRIINGDIGPVKHLEEHKLQLEMRVRWNKDKGLDGTIEILWQEFKLINEESHFNWVYKEMMGYRMVNCLGEINTGIMEKDYFESLIRDRYIISNEIGTPIQYIKKLNIQ